MQKWILTAVSALALVNIAVAGCAPTVHQNGFIDKTGALVVDVDKLNPKPLAIGDYSEGFAPVQFTSSCGYLDKSGAIAFEKPFKHVMPFSEGKAAYSVADGTGEKWGYINAKGDTVIQPIYAAANRFSEGLAAVRLTKEPKNGKSGGRWCYIGDSGKQVIDKTFEQADPFSDGVAAVKLAGKMGSIDRQGTFVVPAKYDVVYAANDGHIVAAEGKGLSGDNAGQGLDYYDKTGNKLLHKDVTPVTLQNLRPMLWVKYDSKTASASSEADQNLVRPLSAFVSPGYCETKSITQAGTKFCIEQVFNARAFAGGYDYIFPVSDGFMVAYNDADGGKMDYRGGVPEDAAGIWNSKVFRFWDAAPFSNGLGMVQEKKGGPYGYVDKTGNFVLKPIYDHARPFHDDRALVGESALHNL